MCEPAFHGEVEGGKDVVRVDEDALSSRKEYQTRIQSDEGGSYSEEHMPHDLLGQSGERIFVKVDRRGGRDEAHQTPKEGDDCVERSETSNPSQKA